MTDIEEKALALINEILKERRIGGDCDTIYRATDATDEALCRAFEQHEAFKQEVSDECIVLGFKPAPIGIGRFIIPKPKSDPLVSAMDKLEWCNTDALAKDLRDTLDALGFEIREKSK